jgi:hypothetical protein
VKCELSEREGGSKQGLGGGNSHKVNGVLCTEDLFRLCIGDGDDELLLQGHADLEGGRNKMKVGGCGVRRGQRERLPEKKYGLPPAHTHLHCIQAVQAKVVNKVSRCRDLLGVHLLKVFQHTKHTLRHLLAVQESLSQRRGGGPGGKARPGEKRAKRGKVAEKKED